MVTGQSSSSSNPGRTHTVPTNDDEPAHEDGDSKGESSMGNSGIWFEI